MPKPSLEEAAKTLRHYLELAINRGGTGPSLSVEQRAELDDVVEALAHADSLLAANNYPPIGKAELDGVLTFDRFDRVVVAQNGIYGRQMGTGAWTRLRTLVEQAAEDARLQRERDAAAAKAAEDVAKKQQADR